MLLEKANKIYLVGIKGTGMSSLAVLLKNLDYKVTGSDTDEKFFTEEQLKKNKISYFENFDPQNIIKINPDLVIFSTAYKENHIEIATAKKSKISAISYPQAIGLISKNLNSVAVCGSHGKTTTTSMLAEIASNKAISLIGTAVESSKKNKKTKLFIFEADEYQNKFRYFSPQKAILTNIDFDHPDFFKTKAQYIGIFRKFISKILDKNGFVIYNYDDKNSRKFLSRTNSVSFGFNEKSDYHIRNVNRELNKFDIYKNEKKILDVFLKVYGKHNILNATAASLMALELGISKEEIKKYLKEFKGAKRRMETISSKKYIIIDDYGHHPTEIRATLEALRNKYQKKKIISIFHPHTFTRTKIFFNDFGKSFKDSDLTVVLDIYPSAREKAGGVHSKNLVKEINKNKSKAVYIPNIPQAAKFIKNNIEKGSVILTIGAGDVWKLCNLIR